MKLFVVCRRSETRVGQYVAFIVAATSKGHAYKVAMAHNCKTEGATTDKWLIQECDGDWDGSVSVPKSALSERGEGVLLCQKRV